MSDFMLSLSGNKAARSLIKSLGISMPQPLEREAGPWQAQPLAGRAVFLGLGTGAELAATLGAALATTGAETWAAGEGAAVEAARGAAGGTLRPLDLAHLPEDVRPYALVYDASGLATPEDLRALYDYFHPQVRGLAGCGRAIVVARPPEVAGDAIARSTRRALEGFVRSLGKELGRRGATAQLVYVDSGAEERLEPALRWLLSKRSAYVSGQVLHLSASVAYTPAYAYTQPLAGKVALVTGAARGIGEATARALAREGAKVIVMDRPAELEAAAKVAESIGGSALACDITDTDAAETILDYAGKQHGGLDILVHNAGITRDKTLANMSLQQWEQVLAVNLIGLVRANEALLPHLRDGGRVIALSSIGGIAGNTGQTNYGATKAGVIGYVQGAAPGVAERGITINAIAPGFIETAMTAAMPMTVREVARRLSSLAQGGLPEDIAEAIVFLASPDAAGLSGQVLRVCGQSYIGA